MSKPLNSAVIGALVRENREAAGLTQTQLAERIGASRFWVAAFEKGKPSAELGLALKAIQALGLSISIGTTKDRSPRPATSETRKPAPSLGGHVSLGKVIVSATLTGVAPSKVTGWPGATAPKQSQRSDG